MPKIYNWGIFRTRFWPGSRLFFRWDLSWFPLFPEISAGFTLNTKALGFSLSLIAIGLSLGIHWRR